MMILTFGIDCDQLAMGLPVTFAVFLIAKSFGIASLMEEYSGCLCYPIEDKA
jgi:hypothetical protein